MRRPRLISLLEGAVDGQVVLVSAPAGYGKTLLLAEWLAHRSGGTAWVSLDGDDNDDFRFWLAVLSALRSCPGVPAESPLHTARLPKVPSRDPAFLATVVDALSALSTPIRLVLDDLHELTAADPLHGLAHLVRDRPPTLQLVLATRRDPPLPLGRLRVAGQLCELRAQALTFSFGEASAMMAAADVAVRPDQVRLLLEQTDGWAAGLRLAALSMREADDSDLFLTDLAGNGRAISDYLIGEILSRLPDDTVHLLHAMSVCDQLSAPLAVALSGREDAGDVLGALERDTSLVVSYGAGRRWFRVHPLLRAHLHADLRRRRPDLVTTAHRRAAEWFDFHQEPVKALWHARMAAATGLNGEFRNMTSLAERAARTAPAGAWRATEGEALTSVLRAYAALMQTQPEECLRLVTPAADFAATLGADAALLPMIDTLRAAARFDLGERAAGFEGLRAARLATRPDRARDEQIALVALLEHRAATQLGHTHAARAVLAWAEARLGTTGEVLLLRAAGPARISRYGAARGHLRPLLDGTVAATVPWPVVDGWLLECWIALRTGVRARAREALRHALSAAEEIGVLRPLTMASPPVLELLAEQLGSLGELEPYARQVLDIRGSREARQPSTPLTERERAVLELLPTLRSLQEIAADLTVSINTVKSHVKSIYGKLGANSRRTAVAAAHRQGLIVLDVRLRLPMADEEVSQPGTCCIDGSLAPGLTRRG